MADEIKVDVKIPGKGAEIKKRIMDAIAKEIEEGAARPETLYHRNGFLQGHGKSAART